MKICIKCGAGEELTEFYTREAGRISSECKGCTKQARKAFRQANLLRLRAASNARNLANPEKRRAEKQRYQKSDIGKRAVAAWNKKNPHKIRAISRKKHYGIDDGQFKSLLDAQSHRCACGAALSGAPRAAHVDHDHASGKVRGILCYHCNIILGHAQDSTSVLEKLIIYLQKSH